MRLSLPIARMSWRLLAVGIACLTTACTDASAPLLTGSIDVVVTASGAAANPHGFEILVDDQPRNLLPGAGRVSVAGLAAGRHTVALGRVATTCTVSPRNPQVVEVPAGASTVAGFDVYCAGPLGALQVITHTTGARLDPDGYQLVLDDDAPLGIGIEDTLELPGLPIGGHRLRLAGLASNCVAADLPFRTATIVPADLTTVRFEISCLEPPVEGTSIIVSVSSQLILAPQTLQYTVVLDGTRSLSVHSTGTVTFHTVPGGHSVFLQVPSYCAVGGFNPQPNPVSVTVVAGEVRTVRFSVLCIG